MQALQAGCSIMHFLNVSVAMLQWQRNDFCHYTFHHGRRVCPHDDQDRLMQHFLDRAHSGSAWAANMLQLTPCDLWPFIQGRTVWLMGDSITQVGGPTQGHSLERTSLRLYILMPCKVKCTVWLIGDSITQVGALPRLTALREQHSGCTY